MSERAIIVDIDGTLIDNSFAESIGMQAYKEAEGINRYYAILKVFQIKAGVPILGEAWGLKTFVNSLSKSGLTKESLEKYGARCIEKNIKEGAENFLKDASKEADLYLVTTGLDIGPNILKKEYTLDLTGYLSNTVIYNGSNEIVSSNIMLTERNVGRRVDQIASDYDEVDIIDDRPQRYSMLNVREGLEVYDSIKNFECMKPVSDKT